jgi:hypothetical protein
MSFDLKIQNGDIAISSTGDLEKVEDDNKLVQDLLKICITLKGSKKKYPYYGSLISKSMIGSVFPEDFINSYASSQLRESIQTLIELQKQQEKFQYISPKESIAAIRECGIQQSPKDPRFYSVIVSVLNKAFNSVNTGFEINSVGL